ncbi:RloB family protein [Roseofilum sp. BLCC_M91]|uniref:RloB family protein n=1 Tax=Roseofilum halophilum BLCC-M91 TaxID=3022259 RepID=A0ABT7BJ37_9CYAN|nr:RloB family protein [Roseofilum halophilum]MDJ1179203.1 RloB family protein [Roseofilum halophilum BLCC-M91]
MARKGKSENKLKRKQGDRKPKDYFLIVVEGKTEYQYFQSLKEDLQLVTTKIEVVAASGGKSGDARKVVQEGKRLQEKEKPDRLYCVFDGDRLEFDEACKMTKDDEPIFSIPCFDLWFLLHFEYTSSPLTSEQVCDKVDRIFKKQEILKPNESYVKEKGRDYYPHLQTEQESAIKGAKRLMEEQEENDSNNPLTRVHLLVEELKKVNRR